MLKFTESHAVAGHDTPWREAIPKRLIVHAGGLVQLPLFTTQMPPHAAAAVVYVRGGYAASR
jgi:hypothetical protein